MKIVLFAVFVSLLANAGCASERLYVKVTDVEGVPVSNAVVHVGFSESHLLFGGGHRGKSVSHHSEAATDTNGNAVVKFNCTSSDFGWRVDADGYYPSNSKKEHFKFEDVIVPPGYGYVILHEHEKHGKVTLWKKKNPQPMIAHYPIERRKVPAASGRY